jgi:limonene-1,2-epoxide hydrolase
VDSQRAWERVRLCVAQRNANAVAECFHIDGRWQNVPHAPAVGRAAIAELLDPVLRRSDRAEWEIVRASFEPHRAWLERVDRFWIDGAEYAVACNAVMDVDPDTGLITEWRDYVDLGEWCARIGPALQP